MQVNQILQGDSLARLKELPAECVDCVITSPPYWALRDYKVEGQLGLEPTFNEYLEKLLAIFDEIKRVLKPTGTVWVNLGDTYNGNKDWKANSQKDPHGKNQDYGTWHQDVVKERSMNIKPKSLLAIPDRFKIAMIDRGWICRNEIIWYKRNCMPSSAKDRFTVDFEKVFFFTKSERYYFETQYERYQSTGLLGFHGGGDYSTDTELYPATKPHTGKPMPKFGGNKAAGYGNPTYSGKEWKPNMGGGGSSFRGHSGNLKADGTPISDSPFGRLKRCVWDITTKGFPDAHFATFPEDLVETPIKAGCPEWVCKKCGKPREPVWEPTEEYKAFLGKGWHDHLEDDEQGQMQAKQCPAPSVQQYKITGLSDCGCGAGFAGGVVLDPFMGSGTVALVALKLARNFLGIELNPSYIEMANKRLAPLLGQTRLG